MADEPGSTLPSEPMQVLDPATVPAVPPLAPDASDTSDRDAVEQLSLGRRLRQPRTIISLVVPLLLLVLLARTLPGFDLEALPGIIGAANPLLHPGRVRDLLPGLPAPRLALGPAAPRQRPRHQPA